MADDLSGPDRLIASVEALRQAGRHAEAVQLIRDQGADGEADIRIVIDLARCLLDDGRPDEALAVLDGIADRTDPRIRHLDLDARLATNQLDTAAEGLRSIVPGSPDAVWAEDLVFRWVRRRIADASLLPIMFRRPDRAAPLERALSVMMVRDEADIITVNLDHQYSVGIRKFVIALNLCADETEQLIAAFAHRHPDALLVTVKDPVAGFYQAGKTNALIDFGRTYFSAVGSDVDWVFVLDADEFINFDNACGLARLLNEATARQADVIAFRLCNATNSEGAEWSASANLYGFFDTVAHGPRMIINKNAVRIDTRPKISMGNHSLFYQDLDPRRIMMAHDFGCTYIHVPYRSTAQIRTKVVNGTSALNEARAPAASAAHWRRQFDVYQQQGESAWGERLAKYHAVTMGDAAIVTG